MNLNDKYPLLLNHYPYSQWMDWKKTLLENQQSLYLCIILVAALEPKEEIVRSV